ncbi:MAG: hypothetical protein EB084_22835 [Proteobacteria bacterium]|nr:hypothetical protein [Pseudomonadota bacterium]
MSSIPDARALEALRRDGEAAMARLDRHCIDVAVYWKQADDLDDPSRSMRFSDACLVGEALETVRGLLPNPGEACDDVGLRVAAADLRGKAAAVSSQLRMRRDPLGRALHTAFDRDSHACVEALEALLAAVAEIEESLLSSAERRLVASLPVLRTGGVWSHRRGVRGRRASRGRSALPAVQGNRLAAVVLHVSCPPHV